MTFTSNPQLDIAFDYVHYTNKNIFLTGKAGTGKTTFLHKIKTETAKRMVIVAPTGVAAINAGGVTIHSFFQLPFGPFLPERAQEIAKQRKFVREKIRLIQSMDLLVIDEISMVRADLLDGIDDVLRRYKNHFEPFGGVQLLMIGDLHQLPPVVKDEEWSLLRPHYDTAYFFGSKALQKTNPVAIELKHIYRQSDTFFIDLLNKVRNNQMDAQVLEALNSRYIPNFQPSDEEAYITLTSHNASAQDINQQKLASIKTPSKAFTAKIGGDFPAYSYPTDEVIEFKTNAQVMFVRNDSSRDKLYYNGKIGKITKIENDVIFVRCPDEYIDIEVSPVEWKNLKYALNESTKEIEEETVGTFTQYPLKLAWAITIHKSQGLTFERAVIDANAAFAHGQVYVALSRCKTFDGIVLRSKIGSSSVKTDLVVRNYSENIDKNAPNEDNLAVSKKEYQQTLIRELFDFKLLQRYVESADRALMKNENIINSSAVQAFQAIGQEVQTDILNIAEKFKPQIEGYFAQGFLPEENEQLQGRIQKASVYFQEKLKGKFLSNVQNITIVTDNKVVKKTIFDALENVEKELFCKNSCFKVSETVFSPSAYLRAKANAELDFQTAQKAATASATPKSGSFKDSAHPDLYFTLKEWREDLAAKVESEEYMILPSKAIIDISNALPTSSAELKRIKGVGEVKIKQFGAEIIAIVEKYCEEKSIQKVADNTLLAAPKPAKVDTKKVSLDLFLAGKTVEEIASERAMVSATIEGHLAHFIPTGEVDIFQLIAKEKVSEIEDFFKNNDAQANSIAFAHFNGIYSYGQLKMVLNYMQSQDA